MLFSIICPTYNVEKYVSECIDSILSQTFNDWEMIIVDDESEDKTKDVINDYSKDKRIKFFSKKHSGQTETRNFGVKYAIGEYILFLDSDDLLNKNTLEYLSFLIHKKKYDILSFQMTKFNKKQELDDVSIKKHIYQILKNDEILEYYYGKNKTFSMCGHAIKRSLVLKGFSNIPSEYKTLRVCEDSISVFEIISLCKTAYIANIIFYYYRQNQNSVSHTKNQKDPFDVIKAFNYLYSRYTNNGNKKVYIEEKIKLQISYVVISQIHKVKKNKKNIFLFARKLFIFKHFTLKQKWNLLTLKLMTLCLKYRLFYPYIIFEKIYSRKIDDGKMQ